MERCLVRRTTMAPMSASSSFMAAVWETWVTSAVIPLNAPAAWSIFMNAERSKSSAENADGPGKERNAQRENGSKPQHDSLS